MSVSHAFPETNEALNAAAPGHRSQKRRDARHENDLLVINSGSSSIKFARFSLAGGDLRRVSSGALERIGVANSRFHAIGENGRTQADIVQPIEDHHVALDILFKWLEESKQQKEIVAVGHRVVHGGAECDCSMLITPVLETHLEQLVPLAPLHLPHNLAGIKAVHERRPDLPQVAAFDTAFHRRLPRIARLTGLPRSFEEDGVQRYGFHGLSYEYIVEEVRRREGDRAAEQRIIVAHLGNGASMAAIRDGRSIETSMGFSTLAGLPMGTRPGDLDPGILLYLLGQKQMPIDELQALLYHRSGLLGISGLSRNMAELLDNQDKPEVREAIDYSCHHARRHLAGLTAALGGLDRIIFTGGIGAKSPVIRERICDQLTYLGVALDRERNTRNDRVISAAGSAVQIEALTTDEEMMIARHTRDIIRASAKEARCHV